MLLVHVKDVWREGVGGGGSNTNANVDVFEKKTCELVELIKVAE